MISQIEKYYRDFDAILISSVPNIIYLTGFSGFYDIERDCLLLFTKTKKYLITNKLYSDGVKEKTKGFEVIDIGVASFITNDYSNILKNLETKTLGIEKDD